MFAKHTSRKLLTDICSALLILLFIYTATSKLISYDVYWGEINNQEIDNRYTTFLTIIIPTAEYLASLLLIFNRTQRWGFYLSLAMMVVFTGYIGLVLTNYYGRIPCSCGGALEQLTWGQHLLLNIFFIIVAAIGSILTTTRRKPGPPPDRFTGLAGMPQP